MDKLYFTGFESLNHILISSAILYVLMIVFVRIMGKRTTAQMNNFDWAVTVAMGSLLASTIILKDVSIADGAVGILALMLLQYWITKLTFHFNKAGDVIKSSPKLLLYKGEFLEDNMEKERVMESEIYAAIRQSGQGNIEDIYAVVLENNANLSIIPESVTDHPALCLKYVDGVPQEVKEELERAEK